MLVKLDKKKIILNLNDYKTLKLISVNNNFILLFNGLLRENFIKIPVSLSIIKHEHFLEFSPKDSDDIFTLDNFGKNLNDFLVKNNVFKKKLKINGLGFKINNANNFINFKLGYSHLISIKTPIEITKFSPRKKKIKIESLDKIKLGNFVNKIYNLRKSDIYKGKGFSFWNIKQKFKEIKKK
jgi:large subunit ribosomal protein L6